MAGMPATRPSSRRRWRRCASAPVASFGSTRCSAVRRTARRRGGWPPRFRTSTYLLRCTTSTAFARWRVTSSSRTRRRPMDESLDPLEQLRATERRAALGTLVAAKGTTPKKEGAKVWVGEGGRIHGSVTIGGCVDARVVQEAEAVLAARAPRLISLSLGDEDAWEIGLTCGGAVDVLVEPVDLASDDDPVVASYERVRAEATHGRASIVVVRLDGRTGRLVVLEDATRTGTLGDPALDAAAGARAAELLHSGVSRVEPVSGSEGDVAVFFEHHGPPGA